MDRVQGRDDLVLQIGAGALLKYHGFSGACCIRLVLVRDTGKYQDVMAVLVFVKIKDAFFFAKPADKNLNRFRWTERTKPPKQKRRFKKCFNLPESPHFICSTSFLYFFPLQTP